MIRPTLAISLLSLQLSATLQAQDVQLHYDVFRDSIYFMKNGKPAHNPSVRDGRNIQVFIENYNNYLYDVTIEVDNSEMATTSVNPEGGLQGLLPIGSISSNPLKLLLGGGGSDQLLGAFKMFPGLSGKDMKEGSGWGSSPEEIARQEQVARLKGTEAAFESIREKIFDLDEELVEIEEKVEDKLNANRLQQFAAVEIAHLRYNPHLEPAQIKQLSTEYMRRIFLQDDPSKLDLPQVLKIADAQNEAPKFIQDYRKKVNKYGFEATACREKVKEFKSYKFPNSNLDLVTAKAEEFVAAIEAKLDSYHQKADLLEEKIGSMETLDPQALMALRTTYLEIASNKFAKSYPHEAKGEKMHFKIILSPLDSLEKYGIREKITPVDVKVYGGLRVKASVGLNFGQFFSRPEQYFVRDATIQSSDKDAFSPILTSFVHFFAPRGKAVSVAGSFGVGFPIGGGESLQAVSFFLGPSLVFGKDQKIVLNAGLMGGKVDRLSQGYKVGDEYFSDSNEAPTSSVYELGYYLGVSFNL